MGNNKPRRQHYISKMLLKNFCNDDGKIWVFDKTINKLYSTNPINLFVKKDLYTYQKLSPPIVEKPYISITNEYKYEKILSDIESDSAPIFNRIIEQVRKCRNPRLSISERNTVKQFISIFARRTPEFQSRLLSNRDITIEDLFYENSIDILSEYIENLPSKNEFYKNSDFNKLKDILISNVNAGFAVGDDSFAKEQREKFIRETGLMIVVNYNPRRSFVIGSQGVTFIHNSEKITSIWIPISYDVMIVTTGHPDKELFLPISEDKDPLIKMVNINTFTQSKIVASRSEYLLKSLSKTKRENFSDALINAEFRRAYDDGKRQSWCDL